MLQKLFRRSFGGTWKTIPEIPKDPILYFNQLFAKDPNPKKVNLSVGAYADENGKPWILTSARMALDKLLASNQLNFSYLPMGGDAEFLEEAVRLAYGFDPKSGLLCELFKSGQIARTQSLSGTGAVFMAYIFVKEFYEGFDNRVYVPSPTWPIHATMAKTLGMEPRPYHYYDLDHRTWDFSRYLKAFEAIPERSFVVVHCTGHNPTGYDPQPHEWEQIADLAVRRKFVLLMDNAYQGFVSGDLEKDGRPIRLMASKGVNLIVCQSFAKSMGLYGQRLGCLSIPFTDEAIAAKAQAYLAFRNRNVFSNPPRFGSDIAKLVLKDRELFAQWQKDIKLMSDSINDRRAMFVSALQALKAKDDWSYILRQKGMFAFTHLKLPHIVALRNEHAIYSTEDGRLSFTGLNAKNVQYVAEAIDKVTKTIKA